MRLLANTPIIVKALFIIAIPLTMLLLWMLDDLQSAYKEETSMQTMLQAADITQMTASLVSELQKERGMSAGFLGGKGKFFIKKLEAQHALVDSALANLKSSIKNNAPLMHAFPDLNETFLHFTQTVTALDSIRQNIQQQNITVNDELAYYIDLIDDLMQISHTIRVIYTFGADSNSAQIIHTTVVPNAQFSGLLTSSILLARAAEAAGIERAVLSNTFALGAFGPGMYERLLRLIALQNHTLHEFSLHSPKHIEKMFLSLHTGQVVTNVEHFRAIALNGANLGNYAVDPEHWFSTSTQRIELLHKIEGQIAALIKSHSKQGLQQAATQINTIIIKGLATIVIATGLSIWGICVILLGIRRTSLAVQSIEAGDYEVPVIVKSHDEIGRMLSGVERMRLSLMATEQARAKQEKKARSRLEALIHAKDELHKKHNLIERLLTTMPSILIAIDNQGNISLWNHVAEKTFGLTREVVTGSMFSSLSIQWDWDDINRSLAESKNSYACSLDHVKFKRTDGSDGFLGLSINAVMATGQLNGFLLIGVDKTERMQLENQLQMSQKMKSMGELAAGIAHEINTPMQYIGDNVRFLQGGFTDMLQLVSTYQKTLEEIDQRTTRPDKNISGIIQQAEEHADLEFLREEVPLSVRQTLEGVAHVSNIVGAMKELSHPGTGDKSAIDINKVIENTVTVSRNEWKYVAELEMKLDPDLPMIRGLPEINQVFLNIIINASHAIEEQLKKTNEEQGKIQILSSYSNDVVEIRISDTGAGIAKDKLGEIFNPFFTTKEPGKGTGQGLAISHQIVCNRLGGQLSVESEPGHGACFIIKLPVAEKS